MVVQVTKWKQFYCPSNHAHTAPVEHYGVDANKHCIWYPEDELEESSSDSSKEETEGASGGGDTVADEEDEGEEDIENLNIEHVDEMNNVLLGKGRRGT